jgi:hypothetical protein
MKMRSFRGNGAFFWSFTNLPLNAGGLSLIIGVIDGLYRR